MKPIGVGHHSGVTNVTPCTGVWIETFGKIEYPQVMAVTPCTGVWIETKDLVSIGAGETKSLPARECGLKRTDNLNITVNPVVTPCTGVWIETSSR